MRFLGIVGKHRACEQTGQRAFAVEGLAVIVTALKTGISAALTNDTPEERRAIYGLVVASDIPLPELPAAPTGESPDVRVIQDRLDWSAPGNPPFVDDYLRGRPQELWMDVPGKLTMRIVGGDTIAYQPHAGADVVELRAFLLGSGLGAVLAQRGALVLHANALAMPDGSALICMGESGAGKSTTAAAMALRGYRMLADDVCPITDDGLVQPGIPRMKLWDDTVARLGIATQGLERLPGDRAKWNVPLNKPVNPEPRKPGLMVVLEPVQSNRLTATRLTGAAKFTALRNNIYRPLFNRALGTEAHCLKRVAEISAATDVIRIARPSDGFEVDTLVDTILELQASRGLPDNTGHGIVEQHHGEQ